MIYEVRTYDLHPRSLPEVIRRFGEGYGERKTLSEMAGFFYSEIGPLNQIVHIWPYEDLSERDRVRKESLSLKGWPPGIAEYIIRQTVEIYNPWPISPVLEAGDFGPFYEFRSYLVTIGQMREYRSRWDTALPERAKHSPVSVVMECDIGTASKIMHIWPYKTLDERTKVRKHVEDTGVWPPKGDPTLKILDLQENKIMLPASFSPMQ